MKKQTMLNLDNDHCQMLKYIATTSPDNMILYFTPDLPKPKLKQQWHKMAKSLNKHGLVELKKFENDHESDKRKLWGVALTAKGKLYCKVENFLNTKE